MIGPRKGIISVDTCYDMGYTLFMITSLRHRGLKRLFETRYTSGVNPQHADRLRKILALLEKSETIDDMDLPGLSLHHLKGKRKGALSVKVTRNWRVTLMNS